MKRTISEVIDLIKQKKESAENTRKKHIDNKSEYASYIDTGYIEAYTDILALLESSHLVEQEKAIGILKEKFVIEFENFTFKGKKGYFINFCGKTDNERDGGIDKQANEEITEKEYKLLSEILKDDRTL